MLSSEDVSCLGLPTDQWGTLPLLYKALVSRFTGTLIFLIDWSVCRFAPMLLIWWAGSIRFWRIDLASPFLDVSCGTGYVSQVVTVGGISRALARSRPEGWFWLLLYRLCWDRSFFLYSRAQAHQSICTFLLPRSPHSMQPLIANYKSNWMWQKNNGLSILSLTCPVIINPLCRSGCWIHWNSDLDSPSTLKWA